MYDMIKEIPDGLRATISQVARYELPRRERVIFTGNGSAFFSVWMGSQVLHGLDLPHEVIQSFEVVRYHKPTRTDLVIGASHSGITKATMDPLSKARELGAYVVGITHFDGSPIKQASDLPVVVGNGPDRSRCHTKTYIVSALAAALFGLKEARLHDSDTSREEKQLRDIPDQVEGVIKDSEPWARNLVDNHPPPKQVVFAGAGPNLVTAREAALKIKESSYLPSEGIELEEEMHGPWVSLDPESLLVVLAPAAHLGDRASTLLKAARKLKVATISVGERGLGADHEFGLQGTDEVMSAYLAIIPLYFYSYFMAVKLGHNPDYLRYLEPPYWDARQDIFPPGTH